MKYDRDPEMKTAKRSKRHELISWKNYSFFSSLLTRMILSNFFAINNFIFFFFQKWTDGRHGDLGNELTLVPLFDFFLTNPD